MARRPGCAVGEFRQTPPRPTSTTLLRGQAGLLGKFAVDRELAFNQRIKRCGLEDHWFRAQLPEPGLHAGRAERLRYFGVQPPNDLRRRFGWRRDADPKAEFGI